MPGFITKCQYFLRAIGLRAVPTTITPIIGRKSRVRTVVKEEKEKIIINRSFWIALSRCGIHLLPMFASGTLFYFNLHGYLIGFELAGISGMTKIDLALMQMAAKAQELLIVASLASVIFDQLRERLLYGDGVPLGLLSSGFSFSSLSWFWSPDFLAQLRHRQNWLFISVLAVCGLIAATAGPASAVLLIPRILSDYPSGGTDYYIPGDADALWPSQIGLEHYGTPNKTGNGADCSSGNGWTSALCPSGGYLSLLNHYKANSIWSYPEMAETLSFTDTVDVTQRDFQTEASGIGINIESPRAQIPQQNLQGGIRGWSSLETSTYAVHGATTRLQFRLNFDWYEAVMQEQAANSASQLWRYRFYKTQQSSVNTQIPAVRVACSAGQFLSANATEVAFPYLPEFDYATDYFGDVGQVLLDVLDPPRSKFAEQSQVTLLPANEQLGAVSATLVFEGPWLQNNSRIVSGCSIDARWTQAVAWTSYPGSFRSRILHRRRPAGYHHAYESFLPVNDSSWRRISISADWLNAVNFIPSSDLTSVLGINTSAFAALYNAAGISNNLSDFADDQGNPNSLAFLEHITATYFADSISRAGAHLAYENATSPSVEQQWMFYDPLENYGQRLLTGGPALKVPVTDTPFTTMRLSQTITGYGYKASTLTDFLALTVLLAHLLIALAHTILTLYTRDSSAAWDTITEFSVLAQQSEPAKHALHNTCAGIQEWGTLRKKVRIRIAPGTTRHVELKFVDEDDDNDATRNNWDAVKVEEAYGNR